MELGRHLHANVASTEPDHVKRSGCQPLFRLPSYNELPKRNRKRKWIYNFIGFFDYFRFSGVLKNSFFGEKLKNRTF